MNGLLILLAALAVLVLGCAIEKAAYWLAPDLDLARDDETGGAA